MLLNAAGERAFGLRGQAALGRSAEKLKLEYLLDTGDDDLLSLGCAEQAARWVVKRTSFRLRGVPHTLLVLSDVSAALREEERIAWERLIRVLGHEINNSLTPIKSIAGSLRARLASSHSAQDRSEEHTSELQSHLNLVCRLLLEKKKIILINKAQELIMRSLHDVILTPSHTNT